MSERHEVNDIIPFTQVRRATHDRITDAELLPSAY